MVQYLYRYITRTEQKMIIHPHIYLSIIKNDQRPPTLRFKSCTLSSRKLRRYLSFEDTWHVYLFDLEDDGITFPRNVGIINRHGITSQKT